MNTVDNIKTIRLVHNGYKILYPRTIEEAYDYIHSILAEHRDLCPEKICDKIISKGTNGKYTKLLRYRYRTVYEEVFLIDVNYI